MTSLKWRASSQRVFLAWMLMLAATSHKRTKKLTLPDTVSSVLLQELPISPPSSIKAFLYAAKPFIRSKRPRKPSSSVAMVSYDVFTSSSIVISASARSSSVKASDATFTSGSLGMSMKLSMIGAALE